MRKLVLTVASLVLVAGAAGCGGAKPETKEPSAEGGDQPKSLEKFEGNKMEKANDAAEE